MDINEIFIKGISTEYYVLIPNVYPVGYINDTIKIAVSKHPYIVNIRGQLVTSLSDMQAIMTYVKRHSKLIIAHCKHDSIDLFYALDKKCNKYVIEDSASTITEKQLQSYIHEHKISLSTTLWTDRHISHNPTEADDMCLLKFQPNKGELDENKFPALIIPTLELLDNNNKKIETKYLNYAKQYAECNLGLLLGLHKGNISSEEYHMHATYFDGQYRIVEPVEMERNVEAIDKEFLRYRAMEEQYK